MKRTTPILAAVILCCGTVVTAQAETNRVWVKKLPRVERVDGNRAVIVYDTVVTRPVRRTASRVIVVEPPEIRLGVGTAVAQEITTGEGADTSGVARSTGAGIGEASTRANTGTGRGGAGIVRSGTLAPSAADPDLIAIPSVPSETVPLVEGGVLIRPTIPRSTTFSGTLGAGTSTPIGVAPGY